MRARPAYFRTTAALVRHRGASRETVEAFRARALRRLVRHAAADVPHYRELFAREGLDPESIREPEDLTRMPVVSREHFQRQPVDRLVARGVEPDRLMEFSTSGTSGVPLTVRRTRAERWLQNNFRLRVQRDYGMDRTDRVVRLSPYRETPSARLKAARFLTPFGPYRLRRIDLRMGIDDIVSELTACRPTVLMGAAGPLHRVARALEGPPARSLDVRLVLSGAETLPARWRADLEETLGATVRDWYGSWEAGLVGWECPRTGAFHLCDDALVAEVVDGEGEPVDVGEEGEVVITVLHSYAMPFVRYRLGDVAVRGEPACPCGAPFSTLTALRGRIMDHFLLPDGREVHPGRFIVDCVKGAAWIGRCEVVQVSVDRIRVRVRPRGEVADARLRELEACVGEGVGPDVRVDVERVDAFPEGTDGAYLGYRSLVAGGGEAGPTDG